jgi:hypothetical protein
MTLRGWGTSRTRGVEEVVGTEDEHGANDVLR